MDQLSLLASMACMLYRSLLHYQLVMVRCGVVTVYLNCLFVSLLFGEVHSDTTAASNEED